MFLIKSLLSAGNHGVNSQVTPKLFLGSSRFVYTDQYAIWLNVYFGHNMIHIQCDICEPLSLDYIIFLNINFETSLKTLLL